jgi:hypothetical protein
VAGQYRKTAASRRGARKAALQEEAKEKEESPQLMMATSAGLAGEVLKTAPKRHLDNSGTDHA